MKKSRWRSFVARFLVAALILAVALAGQRPARADDIHEMIGKLLKKRQLLHKFGGTVHLKQPIAIFHVPVKVIGMPPPWRDAELGVGGNIRFFDGNGQTVGKTVGCAFFPNAFQTGSYLKDVTLRCSKLDGMVTENLEIVIFVIAKKQGQAMALGGAYKPENATQFTVTSYTPATAEILSDADLIALENFCGQ